MKVQEHVLVGQSTMRIRVDRLEFVAVKHMTLSVGEMIQGYVLVIQIKVGIHAVKILRRFWIVNCKKKIEI